MYVCNFVVNLGSCLSCECVMVMSGGSFSVLLVCVI